MFDSFGLKDKTTFTDKLVLPNRTYKYYILPYFISDEKEITGEEYQLKEIKTPPVNFDGEWWKNDFPLFD